MSEPPDSWLDIYESKGQKVNILRIFFDLWYRYTVLLSVYYLRETKACAEPGEVMIDHEQIK